MSGGGRAAPYTPLRLSPGPSPRLGVFLFINYGLALAALYPLPLPWWGRVGLALAVVAGLVHGFLLHVRHSLPGAIVEVVWDELGLWTLTRADGGQMEAELLPDSFVTVPLVVLNFRVGRRRRSLVLTGDSLSPDLLRQLRVRLRLEYGKTKSG